MTERYLKYLNNSYPVITPVGRFPSIKKAAAYHGISYSTGNARLKYGRCGWKKGDVEPLPDRHCATPGCGKLLVKKSTESVSHFLERTHCNRKCAWADPARSRAMSEGMTEFFINNPERRIEAADRLADMADDLKRLENLRRSSQTQSINLKAAWRNGTRIPRTHRNDDLKIIHEGFTDEEVVEILVDTRPAREIAEDRRVYPDLISNIKHNRAVLYQHIDRTNIKIFIHPVRGNSRRPVVTPDGIFRSIRAAARHYKMNKNLVSRWIEAQLNGWRYLSHLPPKGEIK
jgi:hypothetical protein